MEVQFFNFSHDIALAHGEKVFTPPTVVRAMERDLQGLRHLLPQSFAGYTADAPVWGWDAALVYSLTKAGYTNLPTAEQLAAMRSLSSRHTAVNVLSQLRNSLCGMPLIGESRFLTTAEQLDTLFPVTPRHEATPIRPLPAPTYLIKEAYSSSGRGLRPAGDSLAPKTRQWALRCIREQGGVEIEPYYTNKVLDFAMEFTATTTEIRYDGLSVFLTRGNNTYAGNIVAPQAILEDKIAAFIDRKTLQIVRNRLMELLFTTLQGQYLGPIGVDMMVVRQAAGFMLHPCVEINLRRTMGNLALYMLPLLPSGKTAVFSILYHKDPQALAAQINQLQSTQSVILLTAPSFLEGALSPHHAAPLSHEASHSFAALLTY